jgi:hypothetical protein
MTREQLNALLADWHRVVAAAANPHILPGLPQEPTVLRAVPDPCRAFQARWILGNCSDEMLRTLRDSNPTIVVWRSGRSIRYSRMEVCRLAGKQPKP